MRLAAIALCLVGCKSYVQPGGPAIVIGNGPDAGATTAEAGACMWPSAFNPTGAEQAGSCSASAISGPADGGTLSCSSTEYALKCVGEIPVSTGTAIILPPAPAPNSSLGCRGLPLPTAEGVSYYCCPCSHGKDDNPFESGDAASLSEDSSVQSEATAKQDGAACYPLFHACASNDECCSPNRCLNITGTLECQQEGPSVGGPDAGPDAATFTVDGGACVWPASVSQTGDASAAGCWAQAAFNICEVPNGSLASADGTITGPDGKPVTNACHDYCSASEYALTCTTATLSPMPIPDPDPSLGCSVIPVPTPSDALFYCCPCGAGQ